MGHVHLEHPNGEINMMCKYCRTPFGDIKWVEGSFYDGHGIIFRKCLNFILEE